MKILAIILKFIVILTGLTLIVLDLLKIFPVEWERLVTIGGLISAFSVPLLDILIKFGFKKEDNEEEKKVARPDNPEGKNQNHDDSRNSRS